MMAGTCDISGEHIVLSWLWIYVLMLMIQVRVMYANVVSYTGRQTRLITYIPNLSLPRGNVSPSNDLRTQSTIESTTVSTP